MAPKRIQRRRMKGFRLGDAEYVGRGTVWGNPFVPGEPSGCEFRDGGDPTPIIPSLTLEKSLELYRSMVGGLLSPEMHPHGHNWMKNFRAKWGGHPAEAVRRMKGVSLACWCRLCPKHADGKPLTEYCPDCEPCHVDVLGELLYGAPTTLPEG